MPTDPASRTRPSRAIQIADSLQLQAVRGRLPLGRPLGCEVSLCRRFQVGRDTLREAISILEMRGVGRMQRGRKGGLIVDRPSLPLVAMSFSGHAVLHGVTAAQLDEAHRVMTRLAPDMPAPIAELFTTCVEILRQRFSSDGRGVLRPPPVPDDRRVSIGKRRSGQVVREIVASLARTPPERAIRFGSQDELHQRFAISKSISGQVVRLLEDMGIMQARRGRSYGLYVSRPAIRRVTSKMALYLLEQAPAYGDAWQARGLLSLECVRLAAQQPAETRDQVCCPPVRVLEQRSNSGRRDADEIWRVEHAAEALADNLLLTIMIESLADYSALVVRGWRKIVKRFAAAHAQEHEALSVATLQAILAGKAEAAMQLQAARNRLFEQHLRQANMARTKAAVS